MSNGGSPLTSECVHAEIERLLLSGEAATAHEAEEQFLDEHLDEITYLIATLIDEELVRHEAVRLLMSHGSRPWEDGVA